MFLGGCGGFRGVGRWGGGGVWWGKVGVRWGGIGANVWCFRVVRFCGVGNGLVGRWLDVAGARRIELIAVF